VDRAEADPEPAYVVNGWGVRALAKVCRDLDCLLVHYSTDYVFGKDGSRRQPYTETDTEGPVSVYGVTKLAGEGSVLKLCPKHLVVRTCGLYGLKGSGGKGGNFVETMIRLARERKALKVVDDQVCCPTATVDLADTTVRLLDAGGRGLFHVTSAGACSWYEFARTIFRLADVPADLSPTTSEAYAAPARRPAYSVLANDRLRALGLPPLRPWEEALSAYLAARQPRNCA
jgi:dTDP-4-dehydrorhamnose reductase